MPYADPVFLVQIVKVVIEGMASTTTHATPTVPTTLANLEISTITDNVALLVQLVKSMREIGYKPYMGEQDAKIVGR